MRHRQRYLERVTHVQVHDKTDKYTTNNCSQLSYSPQTTLQPQNDGVQCKEVKSSHAGNSSIGQAA